MNESNIASREEITRSLRLLATIVCQQLAEETKQPLDAYESYVRQRKLILFKHFEDLPGALLQGYDILQSTSP